MFSFQFSLPVVLFIFQTITVNEGIISNSGILPEKVAERYPLRANSHATKYSPICFVN